MAAARSGGNPVSRWFPLACVLAASSAVPVRAANNCSTFADLRARTVVTVNTVTGQNRYSPACVMVSVGATVTFNSNFGNHPLYGGLVTGGVATIDPASPIGAHNSGTAPVSIVFTQLGEFPYFCDFHFDDGMMGSVLVDPATFDDGFE